MTAQAPNLAGLVAELRKLPAETGWVEFKENNDDPNEIGAYISALSNSAALASKACAYLVWGIKNETHDVVGTSVRPGSKKKGNEDLGSWLLHQMAPQLHFVFHPPLVVEGKDVVVLEIPRATNRPVQFEGVEYIRVGSYTKKLKDHPQIEKELWHVFETMPFELQNAVEHVDEERVVQLLDVQAYFDLTKQTAPSDRRGALDRLANERMVTRDDASGWNITNLGAVLFAKSLDNFPRLGRKAARVIEYDGKGRLKTKRENVFSKGYAAGFEELMTLVRAMLPRSEVIGHALRTDVTAYPDVAVRELVANALIHQDFHVTGAGPMIEAFDGRIEITNPGEPLVDTDRFIDTPPRSRNEALASFMRRIGICEERGSGIDKVVHETEEHTLPAPIFEKPPGSTRAVLFAPRAFSDMDRAERVRACYLHACLRYVEGGAMTNSSLRVRFGIEAKNAATVSRVIKDALADGRVRWDKNAEGRKYARYLPAWTA